MGRSKAKIMSSRVDPSQIETIVGTSRHAMLHVARAVSDEQQVYILHSARCLDRGIDLLDCDYSLALDEGIDEAEWVNSMDKPVHVSIDRGRLIPSTLCVRPRGRSWDEESLNRGEVMGGIMNGPEHYKQAEKDLKTAEEKNLSTGEAQFYLASAQVHATLALVAVLTASATVEARNRAVQVVRERTAEEGS